MEIPPDVRNLPVFIGEFLTNAGEKSKQQLAERLAVLINELILSDFGQLLNLLYQLDVDESKIKNAIRDHKNEHAGKLIAELIIERQLAKIKSRQEFSRDNDIDEEERW
jgi:hypothetical protein